MKDLNKRAQKYLATGKCPHCKGSDLDHDPIGFEDGKFYQKVECSDCNSAWHEIYTLSNIELIDNCEKREATC